MRNAAILAVILLAAACKDRAPAPAPAETAAPATPTAVAAPPPTAAPAPDPAAEVARLAQRIEACEHFSGEEPYDAARAAELRKQVEANCPGNDAELARLRRLHAANPAIKRQLDRLEQPEP